MTIRNHAEFLRFDMTKRERTRYYRKKRRMDKEWLFDVPEFLAFLGKSQEDVLILDDELCSDLWVFQDDS